MPTDPHARGDKTLEAILGTLKKTNDLLAAQNRILEKMEKYGRHQPIVINPPYLERSDGGDIRPNSDSGGVISNIPGSD
jgi:methylase of polypeptide subunit release factors